MPRTKAVLVLAVIAALLATAAPASAGQLPSPYPQSVRATGPFYGGPPYSYTMCVAPCSFTAFPPTANLQGGPYTFGGPGEWQIGVTLDGPDVDPTPTVIPATGQSLSHVATELGRSTISLVDQAGPAGSSTPFLVVSKADAPKPLKFLTSKTIKLGSVIRIRTTKKKVTATFNYAGTKLTAVRCPPTVKNVHCFRVKRGRPGILPGTEIEILAWNKTIITNTFSREGVADRKLVRVKVLNKS